MKSPSLIALFGLVLGSLSLAQAAETVMTFAGVARNEAGEVVYREQHRVTYRDGRHVSGETRYLSPAGESIARLDSDYGNHPYVPTYRFEDYRFQREDGARVQGDRVTVYGRTSDTDGMARTTLLLRPDMVSGQGLHYFIQDHLQELAAGAQRQVRFLIPLEQDAYTFRIRPLDSAGASADTARFRIEIDNWLWRLFAPYLEVRYELSDGRLLRYEGPSNILNPSGEIQNVTIDYRYPETLARAQ